LFANQLFTPWLADSPEVQMNHILFNSWEDLARTALMGAMAYVVLLLFLRISGKRTLAKMNAFDLIVTVALGSTLATILLNKNVALAEGAVALAVLISLQFAVAWLCSHYDWAEHIAKSEPALLLRNGEPIDAAMLRERVSVGELKSAARKSGIADLQSVSAIILETDGTFSVIAK
jgi:uncharacterized membrane protein YcaP (DUF421 family)